MPILSRYLRVSAAFAAAFLAGLTHIVSAQTVDNIVTRPLATAPEPLKAGRPQTESTGPSTGVGVFERMGAKLPDLPPEKDYKGPVDEAYGAYQRGYYLTAMEKALPRAQLGDPAAQTLMGELLADGLGVKRDMKNAAFWYSKGAEGGDAAAMFKYSLMLIEGRFVKRDKAKADEYMHKAADVGNASAQFNWGQILTADNPGEKGLKLALPYYEKAAEQGIADAQYAVAEIYSSLSDLPEEKKQLAREWMARAAHAGYDTAQVDLGIWLVNGQNGPRDFVKGFQWLRLAANRGNVVAQNKLAHLYINALGTKPDPVEAAKWYVLSRRAGLPDPELEDFYLGIEEDQQKAAIDAANKFRRIQ
ncbi:tetratricopeptide repeat protein [Rhizobium mesoamericanum]|uniref:Putative polar organelle development protein n=1 Tax=Rhizobium mesoamericanum STM3625 TaxID=1211777 RepID=K0Q1N2_9HYPH|nr:tetratricopeptide repeat protein [Rhizobium mesoamericanum]CCM76349.1 putative polar organelle development protein [Rhizobium mesoamericanum STM3625]